MGRRIVSTMLVVLVFLVTPALADSFSFSTGNTDGKMATASGPGSASKFEIQSADDFVITGPTVTLKSATFTGLLTGGSSLANVGQVLVEIYRVFPQDSDTGRTSGPPTFSTSQVPTRVNSPSDVAFASRNSAAVGELSFSAQDIGVFTALNSVAPGGIHPSPNYHTGGDGAITGEEVQFSVNFSTPIDLPADHYFFVPQVEVTLSGGDFYWLSAPRPIVPPGTPFPAGETDLQSWTRDEFLAPDWLRIGTDIVGGTPAPNFNATFSLNGATAVPLPASLPLLGTGLVGLLGLGRLRKLRKR